MNSQKVACVTGASRGIGRAIALDLSRDGFYVIVHYHHRVRDAENVLREIQDQGGNGIIVKANLGAIADCRDLVHQIQNDLGRIDLLINNAGMAPRERRDLLELSESSYDEVMAVNLKGPFFLSQAVARWMIDLFSQVENYTPMIINIGSISAYTSSTQRGEYCLSKAGIGMMTALFADRLAEFGIGVFEIRPGVIETEMTESVKAKYDGMITQGLTPIQRWGQPEDVAKAVHAIVSGMLPFSTGEVINVDGGFHLRRL